MTQLLEVIELSAGYGKIDAVKGVDLKVAEGSLVSVVGPNGAGKSTMLNALMGLHSSTGKILFKGKPIQNLSAEARLEQGLCLVSEKRELFATMSVEDNLQLGAFVRRRHKAAKIRVWMDDVFEWFPRLRERRRQLAGTLSGGERQMLAIGRALMSRPELLMLDEPSLGLAPLVVRDMFQIISGLRAAGVSILLVEQNARAALAASDRAYVLEIGSVLLEGPSEELVRDPRVIATYLGAGSKPVDAPATGGQCAVNDRSRGR
ncbi:MAG: ABC transporter ATP-binding protein [Aquisalimonadaceae bacterium]